MEGHHEEEVTSQVLMVILVFLDYVADAEAVLRGLLTWQFSVIFEGQFEGI